MTIEEALNIIDELKGRFSAPFSQSDKELIENTYYEVLGKTFVPTSCQQCYHDAVVEIRHYLTKYGKMAEKSNYRLRAGAIINSIAFNNGTVYSNDNMTDEVAEAYLEMFPEQIDLFEAYPKDYKAKKDNKKSLKKKK